MGEQITMFGVAPRGSEELSQWFTPRKLAAHLIKWAGIGAGDSVLEPCAGDGAFVAPLLESGASVIANDIDPRMCEFLREQFGEHERLTDVVQSDFLGSGWVPDTFDVVVTNPPYEGGQDTEHLAKAAAVGTRVLALVRTPALHGVDRYKLIWSRFPVARVLVFVRRPSFFLGGDATDGPRHEFCAVVIDRNHTGPAHIEWMA